MYNPISRRRSEIESSTARRVGKITNHLNGVFGSDGELLAASYGKIYEYFGMTIDWLVYGRVIFTMYNYLQDILTELPDDFHGKDVTPTVSDLFQVNKI